MTVPARLRWVEAWDESEALREGIDEVLDAAAANPFLTGIKKGKTGESFQMQPTYLLDLDPTTKGVRYALLATRSHPYHDFREPILQRVRLLLRDEADPAAALATSSLFAAHERPRAAELLRQEQEARAATEAARARRLATASLLSADLEDVTNRLFTLRGNGWDSIDEHLDEYIAGLHGCPAPGGRVLIADALYDELRGPVRLSECEGHVEGLRSGLLGLEETGKAGALLRRLDARFPAVVEVEDPEVMAMLGM